MRSNLCLPLQLACNQRLFLSRRSQHGRFGRPIFRPCLSWPQDWVRHEATEAGDDYSGHILAGSNEAILFFDNVYPLKLPWLLQIPFQTERYIARLRTPSIAGADPVAIIRNALPDSALVNVTGVVPRLKEGGIFVKFSHDSSLSPSKVEKTVADYLEEKRVRPWWNPFDHARTHLVRGRPWVEDLYRPPSSRLKVEFMPTAGGVDAAELSQEQLYSIFRPYGKIKEISPQPSDSKVLPKYAFIDFASTKRAIMAKNVIHGFKVHDEVGGSALTRLKISYEQRQKAGWILDWLLDHPRITIPIALFLATSLTLAVFDPIRKFFIKTHITRTFDVTDKRIYKWFMSRTKDLLPLIGRRSNENASMKAVWVDRNDDVEQIQKWLLETTDTFIVVQGPRGSGKRELIIDQALKNYQHKLVFDCKPVQEARSDSATIDAAAQEVGYRPVFSWMNSISGLIDVAAQSLTGMKTGFSETLDAQMANILNTTAAALKQVGLEGRKRDDKDANLNEDEYLEAHPEKRPVVVIDNFLHKSQGNSLVYDKLAEWAARITTANIAHVIFLTTDVSCSKTLSKALDRIFRQISLGDCTPEVAKRFVTSHLDAEPDNLNLDGTRRSLTPPERRQDLRELDEAVSYFGGRLSDLEVFARRIKAGESPSEAVHEIVDQSASEILKMYVLDGDEPERKWTPQQAWLLIREIAKHETLRYNELVMEDVYKGAADGVLHALEQAELITIVAANGRPASIKPGKPVYLHAFRKLRDDEVLRSRMDLSILSELTKLENDSIAKREDELLKLAKLPRAESMGRINYLLAKLQASQAKIEKYEAEAAGLKRVLQTQF